ncbi:MAG: hypothetical protein HYV03_07070 [Deltaproteobacteria bacterium]|nr:hypothetical protein [Deltaproteobacteria bacterium]
MQVLMIEPSPLARNVYRLILRRMGECKIDEVAALEEIDHRALADRPYDLLIIGSRAFDEPGRKLRALLTDVADWERIPKMIVTLPQPSGPQSPWEGLARVVVLTRPFSPEAFEKAVKQCCKGRH